MPVVDQSPSSSGVECNGESYLDGNLTAPFRRKSQVHNVGTANRQKRCYRKPVYSQYRENASRQTCRWRVYVNYPQPALKVSDFLNGIESSGYCH